MSSGAGESLGPKAGTDLVWLCDVLWGGLPGLRVVLGDGPPGARVLERYAVVPSTGSPRVLLPVVGRAAWAAARGGRATRSRSASLQRVAAGLAARTGVGRAAFDRLTVLATDAAAVPGGLADVLGHTVGEEVLLAVNVRPASPYRKPVAQAVTPDGRVLAYAKIAWNDLTSANVEAEARALAAASGIREVRAPALLARTAWRERPVLVTAPMPARLRRLDPRRAGAPPAATGAVAELFGTSQMPYASGPIGARLAVRLDAVREAGALPQVADALGALLGAADARGEVSLTAGAWHGDWSPWNLAWQGSQLWAWDWEYARADVPLGLDLPHFGFQIAFIGERRGLAVSFGSARTAAAAGLGALGVEGAARELTFTLHVAEVALRYLEAEAHGVAANPRFVQEAVPVLRAEADRVASA